jgi:predicted  nucleic acid-binding Zn-ribbon protein
MRIFLIVSGVLLVMALIVLQQSLGIAPSDIAGKMVGWPIEQKLALAAIVLVVLCVLVAAIWQSDTIARQGQAIEILQKRMNGLRDDASGANEEQSGADAAVRHLVGTDPVVIVNDVQQRLGQAEARTSEQAAQNEAVDLQSRIDEIRRRQQTLRSQLGSVSEKRRVIEPMLGEVKERQALIERALGDLEKDESGKGLDTRLQETEAFLNRGHTRLEALETMFGTFEQLRDRMQQLQSNTSPLRSPESGIKARLNDVSEQQKALDAALISLEKQDDEAIGERLERLAKRKAELEQRIAALNDSFGSLEAMRSDIGEHFEKLNASLGTHLKR